MVKVETFGSYCGDPVQKYILDNGTMSVELLSYGATIRSILVPDKTGKLEDIALGFDDMAGYIGYKAKNPYFGAVVGRVANRIAEGKFQVDGKTYQLDQNNGANALHGGLKALDKVNWSCSIDQDISNKVTFTHTSPAGENGYPGNVVFNVTYQLSDCGKLELTYLAMTSEATPINLTNHCYFNLGGHNAGKQGLLSHKIQLSADSMTPVNDALIPTGKIAPVKGTFFDLFTEPKLLRDCIGGGLGQSEDGYDHNFCIKDAAAVADDKLVFAARAEHVDSGRIMECYTNQPGIQFYTANFLPDNGSLVGKSGAVYERQGGFCWETQNYPDAVNQDSFPDAILRPGKVYKHLTTFKFYVKE